MIKLRCNRIAPNASAYFIDQDTSKRYYCFDIRKALSPYEVFGIFTGETLRISRVRLEQYFDEVEP